MKDKISQMSFWDHLDELRSRIFRILISIVVASCVGIWQANFFIERLTIPVKQYITQLVYLKPTTAFMIQMQVGCLLGFLLVIPYILYELWQFISPGLYPNEKKGIIWWVFSSFILIILGCSFAYYLALPIALKFLLGFQLSSIVPVIPSLTVDAYLTFTIQLILVFGVIFQLPLVMYILSRIGLVDGVWFQKHRKEAIVIILIVAGILTPPDVFSQLMMSIPLMILYELGALASRIGKKKRELVG
jgi:sec-independent protein translocase protein TatC